MNVFPWQNARWQEIALRFDRLPHAILISGAPGSGLLQFAQALAQRLLCETASGTAPACERCPACLWFNGHGHPDYLMLRPPADMDAPELEDASEESEGGTDKTERKALSRQILIDQVRTASDFMSVGAHQGGRRVVLIEPAEAMNVQAANALLKMLEEPPPHGVFLLVSYSVRRLLPTLRSRCRIIAMPKPDPAAAIPWLEAQGLSDAALLLAAAGGAPLRAVEFARGGQGERRRDFARGLARLPQGGDPLELAAQWQTWVADSKNPQVARVDLPLIVNWMQEWAADLGALALGGSVRFFPEQAADLRRLAESGNSARIGAWYNDLCRMRGVSGHTLNARLFIEDMLLRYLRSMARAAQPPARRPA
ncbi:MAG: DNA polymerase III subunit delta' [Rhodocyclaceae bacterium]|nr:DNA polymerase III subunit delta' [Rhodocyclaceae bacterium]MBX3670005.1 DNA polymerase III subunit delta' [Rhodocyclaceae bacterium]